MIADSEAPDNPLLQIDIDVRKPEWRTDIVDVERICRETVSAALDFITVPDGACELSIVLCDDALQSSLNKDYRGQEGATNVLSFPTGDLETVSRDNAQYVHFGDIIIAHETVVAESGVLNVALEDHFRHLIVHGVLHLMGFDHEQDADAEVMEQLETEILAMLDVADPYAAYDHPGTSEQRYE